MRRAKTAIKALFKKRLTSKIKSLEWIPLLPSAQTPTLRTAGLGVRHLQSHSFYDKGLNPSYSNFSQCT